MKVYLLAAATLTVLSVILGWNFIFPPAEIRVGEIVETLGRKKTVAELIAEAQERSTNIKGLYMTADVANDQGAAGTRLRNNLIRLAETTEINALVIDVKEACGTDLNGGIIRNLVAE